MALSYNGDASVMPLAAGVYPLVVVEVEVEWGWEVAIREVRRLGRYDAG